MSSGFSIYSFIFFFNLLIVYCYAIHIRRDINNIKLEPVSSSSDVPVNNKNNHQDEIIHHRGVRIKKVDGLTACFPNDFSYSIKSFVISETNTFECNEEFLEVHADFRSGCGEPLRTASFYLSNKHSCLQTDQSYSPICLRVKT